jgi:hypothetical protein
MHLTTIKQEVQYTLLKHFPIHSLQQHRAYKSFENERSSDIWKREVQISANEKFRYLEMRITNRNYIEE